MSSKIMRAFTWQKLLLLVSFFFAGLYVYADDKKVYPDKPNPPRLVNDFAHILRAGEADQLEQQLDQFSRTTSCQVSIVTVPTIDGHDINEYSVHIFNDWGLGEKGKDNGVLILVTLDNGSGKKGTFITVGKGLQGVLTDAQCGRIVRNEMIPSFKAGDYYKGLSDAANAVIAITKDEYKGDPGQSVGKKRFPAGAIVVLVIFIIFILKMRNRGGGGGGNYMSGSSMGDIATGFLLGNMLGGGRRDGGGGWGGDGGGGFGGFGGFGGGSTDGGGAGGSW